MGLGGSWFFNVQMDRGRKWAAVEAVCCLNVCELQVITWLCEVAPWFLICAKEEIHRPEMILMKKANNIAFL